MNKKILGVFVCMLLITITVLPVTGISIKNKHNVMVNKILEKPEKIDVSMIDGKINILNRGNDILVAGNPEDEYNPSMTSDSNGNLYIAFEYQGTYKEISCYKSTDNGHSWSWYTGFYAGDDLYNPSIAIGEGDEDRLLIAFQYGTEMVWVFWEDLDDQYNYDFYQVSNDYGLKAGPSIVTDSCDYYYWQGYVTWIEESYVLDRMDAWTNRFSVSWDYGENWYTDHYSWNVGTANPEDLDSDIDFGSGILYIAWEEPHEDYGDTNIYVCVSDNRGDYFDYPQELTSPGVRDEYNPTVAAVKGLSSDKTAIVAYTSEWTTDDNDIMFAYTQDGGYSWNKNNYLVYSLKDEKNPDLATSDDKGSLHVCFWRDNDIMYKTTDYTTPTGWVGLVTVNEENSASSDYKPSIAVNPNQRTDQEAVVTWSDFRNPGSADDIYFDTAIYEEPKFPILELISIDGGLLGVSVVLVNYGESTAYDITWELIIKDGMLGPFNATLFFPFKTSGEISSLAPGEDEVIQSGMLGLGQVTVEFVCRFNMALNNTRSEVEGGVTQEWRDKSYLLLHTFPEAQQPTKEWKPLVEGTDYEYTENLEGERGVEFHIVGPPQPHTMSCVQIRDSVSQKEVYRSPCKMEKGQGFLVEQWATEGMVEGGKGSWEVEIVTY